MPDVSGVQILQGTQEFGKDLIFSIRGGFGESILCACVIKKTRITGTVSSSKGARTVFLQAEQAFDTPHLNDSGGDVRVERVYIISPFDLSPGTVRSIAGKLTSRSGQIQFISGSRLFDLFKLYWPGVLADEFNTINEYLSKTEVELCEEKALANLLFQYQLGPADKRIKTVYVPPTLRRDLRSYSVGPDLTGVIPSDSELQTRITPEQYERLQGRIRKFQSAMDALQDWEYVDRDENISLNRQLNAFVAGLSSDWMAARDQYIGVTFEKLLRTRKRDKKGPADRNPSEELETKKRIEKETRKAAEDLFQMEGVPLSSCQEVVNNAVALRGEIETTLAPLCATLETSVRFVDSLSANHDGWLFDPEFVECCRLSEFVQQTPAGVCAGRSQGRVVCSSEILDEWGGPVLILAGVYKISASFSASLCCRVSCWQWLV